MTMRNIVCRIFTILFLIQALCGAAICQVSNPVNYLGLKETQVFDSVTYKLSWSSHPSKSYFKEEYVVAGENSKRYKNMLLIDFLITNSSAYDLVKDQVEILVERKKTDIACNYEVFRSKRKGEYFLDFGLSEMKDGYITVAEWNIYRYKEYTDKQGHKGVLLIGLSYRAYDDDIDTFLSNLIKRKRELLKRFNKFPYQDVQIK
jgi:hypothetical protein